MKVAFTGHRPEQLFYLNGELAYDENRFDDILLNEISRCIREGYDAFYCGAARGADIICGEWVIDLRDLYEMKIRLICVVPFADQAAGWGDEWKKRYWHLRYQADQNVVLSEKFTPGCYQARNRYMVDHADRIIAVYNGCGRGGTAYTIDYAKRQGKEVVIIDPGTLQVTVIPAR